MTNLGTVNESPSVSSDGALVLFCSDRQDRLVVHLMTIDGSDVRRLTTTDGLDLAVAWRPRPTGTANASAR